MKTGQVWLKHRKLNIFKIKGLTNNLFFIIFNIMIIKLKSFKDLGKCSFGTMLDKFDTKKEHIYFCTKPNHGFGKDAYSEIKINDIDDLCKFLWCIPGISTNNNYYFHSTEEWWQREYGESIEMYNALIEKCKKSLARNISQKRKDKLNYLINYYENSLNSLEYMIKDNDKEKKDIISKLREENKK